MKPERLQLFVRGNDHVERPEPFMLRCREDDTTTKIFLSHADLANLRDWIDEAFDEKPPEPKPGDFAEKHAAEVSDLCERHGIPQFSMAWPVEYIGPWLRDIAAAVVVDACPREICRRCGSPIHPGEGKGMFRVGNDRVVEHLSCPVAKKEKP